jgi:ElaB/YqjD/DUF883 family membrane-anchored ribosome-binding protein
VKARALELARRREALLARSSAQRAVLAAAADHISGRLDRIDQRINSVRRFLQRPWLLLGVVAAAGLLLGPRKMVRIATRGAVWVNTVQRVAQLVR